MPDPFPAEPGAVLDDLRMMVADLAVQCGTGAYAIARQNLHDPPHADPVAVVAHRPVAYIRDLGVLSRHPLIDVARHHIVEPEELDIGVDPQCDPRAVWPGQLGAVCDRDIAERPITARCNDARSSMLPDDI